MGIRLTKVATDLSDAARAEIAKRNFALTGRQSNTGKPAYPIHDREHARAALGMVGMHGTSEQKAEVRKDVARRYPDMIKKVALALPPGPPAGPSFLGRMRGALSNPHVQEHLTEIGGLGVLAVPGIDHLQAQARASLAGDDSPGAVEHRQLMGEGAHAALDVGGLGILAAPEIKKLMALKHAMVDELLKIGAVSDEQAARAADRLDTLERQAVTPGQVARNAAFGAVTVPALSAIANVVKGGARQPITLRSVAADALKGGVGSGLLPLAQRAMDRRAEESTLRDYLNNSVNNEGREFTNAADKMASKREDSDQNNRMSVGTIGGGLAARHGGRKVTEHFGRKASDLIKKDMNPELLAGVRQQAGIPVMESPGLGNAVYVGKHQANIFKWLKDKAPGDYGPMKPLMDNLQEGPQIHMDPRFNSPSVLSHEIGHHQFEQSLPGRVLQHPVSTVLSSQQGAIGGLSGALTGALSDDPRVHAAGLLLPAALSAGQLISEGAASLHGMGNLRRAGASAAQLQVARNALGAAFGTYAGNAVRGMGTSLMGHGIGRTVRNMRLGGTSESRFAEQNDKVASWKDRLKGGIADDKKPEDFDSSSLRAGAKVEREHTSDKHLQKEVAMDHLKEDPKYYGKLKAVEKEKDSGFMDAMKGALTSPIPGTGRMPIIGGIGQNVANATRSAAPAAAKGSGSFSDFQKAYRSTPAMQPRPEAYQRQMGAPPPMRGAQSDAAASSRSGPRSLPLSTPRSFF